ncbi:MAG TPA: bifunctional biotin--[acetyl-CoA-carboxylase] ligase/biotin operon repressor BirA [Burkholderiales bacterium]|nr:bifunctional biotin--[acetyl-CoA-carboxylase] ligase/biotin operon repressor BirA [Burkholderiales bacterium]
MSTRTQLIQRLSDGKLQSGTELGRVLRVSRAAVFKAVKSLGDLGVEVEAVAGRGYRLREPLVPLERKRILAFLGGRGPTARQIEILEQVDSTNRYLLEHVLGKTDPSGKVCLAEAQTQGRGRRGRTWITTPYRNLMLSMAWRFAGGPAMVAGLSLAAGVAIVRALERYGVRDVGLKWPNDLLCGTRKLAGLLVDVQGEATGPCTVVLGVGINCHLAASDAKQIDQAWTDLQTETGATVDRNRLAAFVIDELHRMFATFAERGLAGFRAEWERRHLYTGKPVSLHQGDRRIDGVVEGVDDNGALRLRDTQGDTRTFFSGEVSLRASAV